MLDIRFVRENPELVKENIKKKFQDAKLPMVDEVIELDAKNRAAITEADLIIAKGQGNFETLQGCGLNIYYAFLCKCRFFADRFGVPVYTGMLVREGR